MSLTFVIGGARSGKSTFAEAKAKEYSQHVLYIASAVVTDQAMADRVKRHREQRPASWHTLEAYGSFDKLIANYMVDSSLDFDTCSVEDVNILEEKITNEVFSLIDVCNNNNKKLIIVSNETGMGLVPFYYMGNYFRDISGRINSNLGLKSDNMYFIFSGIPIKLKDKGEMVKWPQDF